MEDNAQGLFRVSSRCRDSCWYHQRQRAATASVPAAGRSPPRRSHADGARETGRSDGGMREARTVALVMTEGWRLFQPRHRARGRSRSITACSVLSWLFWRPDQSWRSDRQCGREPRHQGLRGRARQAVRARRRPRLRDLTARANRANVSFYPVNPAGLVVFDTPISENNPPSYEEDSNGCATGGTDSRIWRPPRTASRSSTPTTWPPA